MKLHRIWMPVQGTNQHENQPSNYYWSERPVRLFGKLWIWVIDRQCTLTLNGKPISRTDLEQQMKQKDETEGFILWGIVSGEVTMRGDDPDRNGWTEDDQDFVDHSSKHPLPTDFVFIASEIHFHEDPSQVPHLEWDTSVDPKAE